MKKITLKNLFAIALFTIATTINAQTDNVVSLKPTGSGSEGNALYSDSANISVDASGVVTLSNADWDFSTNSGTITLADAFNTTFTISTKGVFDVSQTDDETFGDIIAPGGIDRASSGDFGIRNPDAVAGRGNGIDYDEGFVFGFNLENVPSTITLQITGIAFSGLSGSEIATVTNRTEAAPKPRLTFDINGNGFQDVSSLNLYVTGGAAKLNLVSVFNSSDVGGNFRVVGVKFQLLETATLSTRDNDEVFATNFSLNQNPVSNLIAINYNKNDVKDFTASLIDLNGRIVQEKKSNTLASSDKITFDATALSSGLYFVKIQEGTRSAVLKVIKQ